MFQKAKKKKMNFDVIEEEKKKSFGTLKHVYCLYKDNVVASFEFIRFTDKAQISDEAIKNLDHFSDRWSDCARAAAYVYKTFTSEEKTLFGSCLVVMSECYVDPKYRHHLLFTEELVNNTFPGNGLVSSMGKYGAIIVRFIPSNGIGHESYLEITRKIRKQINDQIKRNVKNIKENGWIIIPSEVTIYANNEFAYIKVEDLDEHWGGHNEVGLYMNLINSRNENCIICNEDNERYSELLQIAHNSQNKKRI